MLEQLVNDNKMVAEEVRALEGALIEAVVSHMRRVALHFIKRGYDVYYRYGLHACIHKGGIGYILIKGLTEKERDVCRFLRYINVDDYDEFFKRMPLEEVVRITQDNIDGIKWYKWIEHLL